VLIPFCLSLRRVFRDLLRRKDAQVEHQTRLGARARNEAIAFVKEK
jgi:hypothetical protein